MLKASKHSEKDSAAHAPSADPRPMGLEKEAGPLRGLTASGASGRAGAARQIQRSVGNTRAASVLGRPQGDLPSSVNRADMGGPHRASAGEMTVSHPGDPLEQEAERNSREVTETGRGGRVSTARAGTIFRDNGQGGPAPPAPTLDTLIRQNPPGFTDQALDRAYQDYRHGNANPLAPRTWALRQTTGGPRQRLELLLGPDYARGQLSAAARPPVNVTQATRPEGYTDPQLARDVQTLRQNPADLVNRLEGLLRTPITGGEISAAHYNILQGNVGEVLARPLLQGALEEVRRGQPDANLFLGVRARLHQPDGSLGAAVQFTDGLIAAVRGGRLHIFRVGEIKSGAEGGVQAQEQIFRWIEAHSTVGFVIELPGIQQGFEYSNNRRDVVNLTTATRLAIVPRGARFAGEGSGHGVAAPTQRLEFPQSPGEIQYITRLVAQEIIQFQQAVLMARQVSQHLLNPAAVATLAELQSPEIVRRIQAQNGGLALVDGKLYRVSLSGNAGQIRLLTPARMAVPKLPAGAAAPAVAMALPAAAGAGGPGRTPALPPPAPARPGPAPATGAPALPAAGGGPRPALPGAGGATGPVNIPGAPPQTGPVPPNILNFTERDIVVAGRQIAPSEVGTARIGEPIVVGFGNYWIVSNAQTRQPIAGVLEGGTWYAVGPGGTFLPLDAEGRIDTRARPIAFEALPEAVQRPPAGPAAGAAGRSPGMRAVAGGLGIIMVANEILGPIGAALNVQRRNIAIGHAQINFWSRFGANPDWGVWDWEDRRDLPADTSPDTHVLTAETVPYVRDIDPEAFRRNLPQLIHNYQEFLLFLDLVRSLEAIREDPPMPGSPSREERRVPRRYTAVVNWVDRPNRKEYDVTDVIEQVRDRTLGELDQAMKDQLRALPQTERNNIFRLKSGSETPLFRSAGGGQPILSGRQVLGPDPWVRPLGGRVSGGISGWFFHGHSEERVLVVPANADAQRSALVSAYVVKKDIDDTLDEVRDAGRPIRDRVPGSGRLNSFVAGPEPGESSRFGDTRYYRHPEFPDTWTAAIGELRRFWVNADDLEPVAGSDVEAQINRPPTASGGSTP